MQDKSFCEFKCPYIEQKSQVPNISLLRDLEKATTNKLSPNVHNNSWEVLKIHRKEKN